MLWLVRSNCKGVTDTRPRPMAKVSDPDISSRNERMTGLFLGIPSMALSQAYSDRNAVRWDTARAVAPKVIMQFAKGCLEPRLNPEHQLPGCADWRARADRTDDSRDRLDGRRRGHLCHRSPQPGISLAQLSTAAPTVPEKTVSIPVSGSPLVKVSSQGFGICTFFSCSPRSCTWSCNNLICCLICEFSSSRYRFGMYRTAGAPMINRNARKALIPRNLQRSNRKPNRVQIHFAPLAHHHVGIAPSLSFSEKGADQQSGSEGHPIAWSGFRCIRSSKSACHCPG